MAETVVADRQGDLFRELLEQGGHLLSQVVPTFTASRRLWTK